MLLCGFCRAARERRHSAKGIIYAESLIFHLTERVIGKDVERLQIFESAYKLTELKKARRSFDLASSEISYYLGAGYKGARSDFDKLKEEAKRVYEAIRYANPTSSVALAEINLQIERELSAFSDAVSDGDATLARAIANTLVSLIEKRNAECKLTKNA